MKRIFIVCLSAALMISATRAVGAQTLTPNGSSPAIGDRVLVNASLLPVYTHPADTGPVSHELVRGMASRLLKIQADQAGNQWLYLSDSVHGWVRAVLNNQPSVVAFTDHQLQTIITDSTATLTQNAQSVDAYLIRAMAYDAQRDFKDSGMDFGAAMQIAPDDARLYYYRSILDGDVYDYQQEVTDSQKAIGLNRTLAFSYTAMGLANLNLGNTSAATDSFMQAKQAAPDFGISYYGLAHVFESSRQYDEALTYANAAVQHDPLYAIAYSTRGGIYQNEQQYDLALQDFNQAIVVDPYCSNCYLERGVFFAKVQGDQNSALNDFNKAIELFPFNATAYGDRGVSYEVLGNYDQAVADLVKATQLNPTDDGGFFHLGGAYAAIGQYAKGIDAYNTVEKLNGHYATSTLLYRPQLYLAVGNYDAAINDLETYTAFAPGEYFTTVGHLVLGEAYLYKHQYDKALTNYQIVTSNPSTAGFVKDYYNQGGGFRVTRARQTELTQLAATVSANPNDATSVYALATLDMEFGLWSQASQSYKQYFNLVKTPLPDALMQLLQLLTA